MTHGIFHAGGASGQQAYRVVGTFVAFRGSRRRLHKYKKRMPSQSNSPYLQALPFRQRLTSHA